MKKIYFMLISFLCAAFAVQAAPVTDLAQLSNDKVYTIRSERAFLLYSANVTKLASSNGKSVGAVTRNPQDPNQQFKIENKNGTYYLYSVGAEKYVIATGYNANPYMALTITSSGNANYPWKLGLGTLYLNSQDANQTAEGLVIDTWSKTDAGNSYIIEEVTDGSSASTEDVYDFTGFGDEALLNLFYNALQQGRNYPTMEEFEAAGIQASDIAFVRSHVRRANIMSRADRLRANTFERRNLFLNIPMDYGKDGAVGHPEAKFNADVFSMWQYTNLWGSWNHSIFTAPGAWVDAAHRNGTDIMSGIKFFDTTGGRTEGAASYEALISKKDANGDYMYVKPLINILMFFGSDGINYNWEDTGYSDKDVVQFHKALYRYATECGFDSYHSAIYCAVSELTNSSANIDYLYGTKANGKTHDLMLNYQANDIAYNLDKTYEAVKAAYGEADGLYAGVWIASMDRRWTNLEGNNCNICLWGEHDQSRFYSFNAGDGVYDIQGNYQRLLERGFSGGNRNPANLPALSNEGNNWVAADGKLPLQTFAGMAHWIPERSAIQGNLPFGTHFTLGNGDRYFYKGKMAHKSGWYNMGSQDIVPTYRWLRYKTGTTTVSTDVDVNYTHLDAYTGGSCIELTGAATSEGTDIILYKTSLKAGSGAYAKVAVKTLKDVQATNLYLIVKKQGSNAWQEYPVGNVSGKTWEEKKFDLTGIASGDVIERIGLRVKGNNNDYQLYVGKLEINDNNKVDPANVKDLVAEVKNETKTSMNLKLHWNVDAVAKTRADWGLVYNDEANISHFEIMYKNGEDGRVAQVGTTSQWATFVGNIEFTSVNDVPFIGVRSVSTDLKTYSPIVWVEVPRGNQADLPEKVEEDTYGVSQIDPASSGIANARAQRYVDLVTTTGATKNLNYTASSPVADGTQYADARDHVLEINQGQEITMTIRGANYDDGLKWCYGGGWLDLNGSGDFDHPLPVERTAAEIDKGITEVDPEGERIFFVGTHEAATPAIQSPGITFTFKVPADATPGDSRLRIVFSDAWFAGAFNPTGLTNKGFTIDFGVKITGNNPGRAAADTRDQGVADEPECLEGNTSVEDVVAGEVSTAEGVEGAIDFNNADKAWIYTADGKLVNFVLNPATVAVETGVYVVKMQKGNVIRSAKVAVK
ncbi:MAG: endo-beta-N-acetylglucosaminidase [Bacteroidaceae bacterium]|nr:endo-beta-N-acetylglucosaminidase [Bacteroidaceae bacterium]